VRWSVWPLHFFTTVKLSWSCARAAHGTVRGREMMNPPCHPVLALTCSNRPIWSKARSQVLRSSELAKYFQIGSNLLQLFLGLGDRSCSCANNLLYHPRILGVFLGAGTGLRLQDKTGGLARQFLSWLSTIPLHQLLAFTSLIPTALRTVRWFCADA